MRQEACAAAREAFAAPPGAPHAPADGADLSAAEVREAAMEASLNAIGELGYRSASVRAILEHSGGNRVQFYRHFASKEDCFNQAYASWIERLGVILLEAAVTAPDWQPGLRAALVSLFQFVTERPPIARALFVEVQIAGGPALAKREEALGRLAHAVDSVRGEIEPDLAPPESTAMFVVGGIEACVSEALTAGEPGRIWDALPELMHFAVGSYMDAEAAEAAFEEGRELIERERAELGDEVG